MLNKVANVLRLLSGIFFLAIAAANIGLTIVQKNDGLTTWMNVLVESLFTLAYVAAGLLTLNRDKWVKIGLAVAVVFGAPMLFVGRDLSPEDIPNIVAILLWALLLFGKYEKTFMETIRRKKEVITSVIGS